jgi:hypothetical protein
MAYFKVVFQYLNEKTVISGLKINISGQIMYLTCTYTCHPDCGTSITQTTVNDDNDDDDDDNNNNNNNNNNNSVALVSERTIPTERQPLVGQVSANFCR